MGCYRPRMLRVLILLAGLTTLGCGSSEPTSKRTVLTDSQKLSKLGRQKLSAGDKAGAYGHFKAAIQTDKASPEGRYGLAVLHILEGNEDAAQQELLALRTGGADVDGDAPWLTALLDGRKHFPVPMKVAAASDTPPAKKPSEKPAKKKSASEADLDPESSAFFREGKYSQVVARLTAVANPSVFQLKLLADAHYNLQDWTRSVAAYRRVLRSEPGNEVVTLHLADALLRLQRYDESITFYRVLAEANPDKPGFWRLIGDAATAKKDWEVALASYKKAVSAGYDDPSLGSVIDGIKAELAKATQAE